jgi:integrase
LQDALGFRPMREIRSPEIKDVLTAIARKGNTAKAKRVQALASRIFCLAVAGGICDYDVAAPCKKATPSHVKKKKPALTDHIAEIGLEGTERLVGLLLRAVRAYTAKAEPGVGKFATGKMLELMALTFPRPLNIVTMRWDELSPDGLTWIIPKGKMKMRRMLRVPLSPQARAILAAMRPFTGKGEWVFFHKEPKAGNKQALTRALKKIGYDTDQQHCAHGFRSVASTLLNESGLWSADAIELQLAHKVGQRREQRRGNSVRGSYNSAERIDERAEMMLWWGDYLEHLCRTLSGAVVNWQQAAE